MQRSTDRIYTTHVGSLARPAALLDLMRASAAGEQVDQAELDAAQRRAVADVVARQRAAGIDVINDGEQGKTGFFAYIAQRLSGYEPRGRETLGKFRPEIEEFPEYYGQYFQRAMTGGMAVPAASLACTGPVSYTGQEELARDLSALRAAVGGADPERVFVCAVAPSGVGGNEYYRAEDEYLDAVADRIVRFAEVVGRENVVASADCGFSSQATYSPEIHPKIVWAKFESLAEGARRATDRLW
jgi:5-methyltetrahydropteroyltriglutamate--homocysteine methyltransferase